MLIQSRLVLPETLDHLHEHYIRLLDLLLLGADFLFRLADIQSVAINQRGRLGTPLMVGLNPILGRKHTVAERLHSVTDCFRLGFQFLQALSYLGEFGLLARDLLLVALTRFLAAIEP